MRPSSDRGVLHRESRLHDHRDDVPRPSIQWWQGRAFESQHAGPLPVGGWRSPHRSSHGIWRIKFAYDDFEPLSMDAQQASQLAISLHGIGEDELAGEINEAVARAAHYETM